MGIIAWIIFGLIAGVIAKLIMPGRDGGGFILTCILGIVGAVVGGWLATMLVLAAGMSADLISIASWWPWRDCCAGCLPACTTRLIERPLCGNAVQLSM